MAVGSEEDGVDVYFPPPRIRHITGIRIHQLTLPESLAFASKLAPPPVIDEESSEDNVLGEPSRRSRSPDIGLVSSRRLSNASARVHLREGDHGPPVSPKLYRAISSSRTITTVRRERVGRARAPTLAGEALEALEGSTSTIYPHPRRMSADIEEEEEIHTRRLARCLVVLKMPEQTRSSSPLDPNSAHRGSVSSTRRELGGGGHAPHERAVSSPVHHRQRLERQDSTHSLSQPSTPSKTSSRPPFSQASSRTSASATSPARSRTTSLPSTRDPIKPTLSRTPSRMSTNTESSIRPRVRSGGLGHPPFSPSAKASLAPPRLVSNGRPDSPPRSTSPVETTPDPSPAPTPVPPGTPAPEVPFLVTSIHRPSTHPRWLNLSSDSDFAPWLPDFAGSDSVFELQLWYEDKEDVWRKLEGVSRTVDMRNLRRLDKNTVLPDNTLQVDLASDLNTLWYLPLEGDGATNEGPETGDMSGTGKKTTTVRGIVEKSMRETRMKKGLGIGGLQQLVNTHAVIVDTQRGIVDLQRKIDKLLFHDVGAKGLKRDIEERENRIKWIQGKVAVVEATTKEVEATITLQRRAVEERHSTSKKAREKDALLQGSISEVATEVDDAISEHLQLLNRIHHHRSLHAQTLDFIFPITPVSPAHLLYSIVNVPLPIPVGPKNPAPLLNWTSALPEGVKIDERVISAALGYVAMAVYLLGGLSGSISTLPYPLTCLGSRSIVKDVVSLMQGPRSFPLYAKGVELYRYEYAVFLLNKDIESMMHENSIRLLDLRHTLPNLKSLFLTLSSPVPPAVSMSLAGVPSAGSSTYVGTSRTSSRQTSAAWPLPPSTPGDVSPVITPSSPASTRGFAGSANTPSPLTRLAKEPPIRGPGVRRSQLGKVARSQAGDHDIAINSETEDETDSLTSGPEERNRRDSVREKYERGMPAQIPLRKAR